MEITYSQTQPVVANSDDATSKEKATNPPLSLPEKGKDSGHNLEEQISDFPPIPPAPSKLAQKIAEQRSLSAQGLLDSGHSREEASYLLQVDVASVNSLIECGMLKSWECEGIIRVSEKSLLAHGSDDLVNRLVFLGEFGLEAADAINKRGNVK